MNAFRLVSMVAPALAGVLVASVSAPQEKDWVELFNGENLAGWTPKITGYGFGENYANTFRVEDGVIQVRYDGYEEAQFGGKFGHLFYKSPFSSYEFEMEYRFVGDQLSDGPGWAHRNSGVMIHSQVPDSMGKDQDFPVSIEVQLLGGTGSGDRPTANLCTPGTNVVYDGKLDTRHCINSASKTFHGEQWVKVGIVVHGNGKITHKINGEKVMEYEQSQLDPNDGDAKTLIKDGQLMLSGGYISLQSESHPVDFRNIRLREIK